jgi:excisionase family DNA binding protein
MRISATTLLKMARAKLIPAILIGRHWRFRASSLNAYIESQTQKEPPTNCASKSSPPPKPRLRKHRPGGVLARYRAMNSVPPQCD